MNRVHFIIGCSLRFLLRWARQKLDPVHWTLTSDAAKAPPGSDGSSASDGDS